jgi:crossover junction endodeoxyribonuclease RuvC
MYLGVDPGMSGAIALVGEAGQPVNWFGLGHSPFEVYEWLSGYRPGFAVLEQVHAMPKQGVSSTFKFGTSYGRCEMLLAACQVPFDRVTPAKWQQAMRCRSKGDKNVTKRRAIELFPGIKITHRNADAFLLAEFCRRLRLGLLEAAA